MVIETAVWIVFLAVVGGLLLWLIGAVSRGQVMRCPDSGSVAFVRAGHAAAGKQEAPRVAVTRCSLWPERQSCTQQCLARYGQTTDGLRVKLEALRPFEPR